MGSDDLYGILLSNARQHFVNVLFRKGLILEALVVYDNYFEHIVNRLSDAHEVDQIKNFTSAKLCLSSLGLKIRPRPPTV